VENLEFISPLMFDPLKPKKDDLTGKETATLREFVKEL
jgi:hypothetical protein